MSKSIKNLNEQIRISLGLPTLKSEFILVSVQKSDPADLFY